MADGTKEQIIRIVIEDSGAIRKIDGLTQRQRKGIKSVSDASTAASKKDLAAIDQPALRLPRGQSVARVTNCATQAPQPEPAPVITAN